MASGPYCLAVPKKLDNNKYERKKSEMISYGYREPFFLYVHICSEFQKTPVKGLHTYMQKTEN